VKIDARVSDANLVMAAATCRARSQAREVRSTGRGGGECSEGIACEVTLGWDGSAPVDVCKEVHAALVQGPTTKRTRSVDEKSTALSSV
jgi:hypothetical protein